MDTKQPINSTYDTQSDAITAIDNFIRYLDNLHLIGSDTKILIKVDNEIVM